MARMKRPISFTLNGSPVTVAIEETVTLLEALRGLGLTSPRYGCGAGECGTCAVLIDGEDKPSCSVPAGTMEGRDIVTVEGIDTPDAPHAIQHAFLEKQAGQCGYCLSGLVVGAKALLDTNPSPTRQEIARALSWHLCRCGIHNRIIDAILLAAERLREGGR
jgi:nicotinate dehydrogenase subunit A